MGEYWRKFVENRHSSYKIPSTVGLFKSDPLIVKDTRLQDLSLKVEKLPTSKPVYKLLNNVCESETSAFEDFEEIFSSDPALLCNLLRLVNTSYFSNPRKIVTIRDALKNLEPNTIKNLLFAARENSFSENQFYAYGYLNNGFFKHSVTTAVLAQLIALKMDYTEHESEAFYVSGLLHDVGKLVLLHFVDEETPDFFDSSGVEYYDLLKTEKKTLLYDHVEVGNLISNKIRLSEEQKAQIKYHHDPLEAGINRISASILHCANYLAKVLKVGLDSRFAQEIYVDEFALELLGLERSSLLELAVNSIKTIEMKHNIFNRS